MHRLYTCDFTYDTLNSSGAGGFEGVALSERQIETGRHKRGSI